MCTTALAETLGIVGQGTLKAFVPQCFGVNNKGFKYFLNFVNFFGPHSRVLSNSPGQLITGPHLCQPHLAFPDPVKVYHGHLHLSMVNLPRGSRLITVLSLVSLIVLGEHNLFPTPTTIPSAVPALGLYRAQVIGRG